MSLKQRRTVTTRTSGTTNSEPSTPPLSPDKLPKSLITLPELNDRNT